MIFCVLINLIKKRVVKIINVINYYKISTEIKLARLEEIGERGTDFFVVGHQR